MRISIDATPLLLRSAGVKNHIYYWIRHLRRLAGQHQILTFPVNARIGDLTHEASVVSDFPTVAGLAWVHLANYTRLPLLDWFGRRTDVFHASHQLWNPPRKTRLTATVYDMTCWLLPETHSPANIKGLRAFADHVLRRADGLIAISESTRSDATRILGLAPERIEVVYPGVAESFFQTTLQSVCAVKERYSLLRPYVLFVGTIEPRKNVPRLLDAWQQLSPSTREEFELVVAGPVGWSDRESEERLRAGAPGLRFLGYVPEADLPALTAGALAFAYPSLYEGFGFPVAQAMAAGVPLLTSNVSSLPEIARDAAVLVDPRSVDEIRAALEQLLGSPALRAKLGTGGRQRARRFRWDQCARKSLRFFERVAGAM